MTKTVRSPKLRRDLLNRRKADLVQGMTIATQAGTGAAIPGRL